jgi:DNA-binding transcriptional MocR family regulator
MDELELTLSQFDVRACVLVSNFNNPDGISLSRDGKEQLARLAQKNSPIIEDDIYGELYFGAQRQLTIQSFDTEGWVMLCFSFSKTLAPGFRIGRFARQVERLKFMTNIATPLLTQMVIAELLRSGRYDRHLRRLRVQLQTNAGLLTQRVQEIIPKGTKPSSPTGGYVLWVELPKTVNSLALQKRALVQKIGILPGVLFSNRSDFPRFIRLSFGEEWNEHREKALLKLI